MVPDNNPIASRKAESTYLRVNNILKGSGQFPNITTICSYCDTINEKLGAYIRNKCLDITKEDSVFSPSIHKTNSILNGIDTSKRKNIRILLYPGERHDVKDLNMNETTHNMIVQFKEPSSYFVPTEPHNNPPCFYQICGSEEIAILYFESLLVDACICHYLSISDVAYYHDEKQKISSEKVMFLQEVSEMEGFKNLTDGAKQLVSYVASQLTRDTPYISFLSIFTIAPFDVFGKDENFNDAYFEDYCKLWNLFQKWYFNKHGRMFFENKEVKNPLESVFSRNKYKGQISPNEIENSLNLALSNPIKPPEHNPFGEECRYAFIIIKHMPNNDQKKLKFESLFSGQLHQAKWKIIHWSEIDKYNDILSYIEIVPFLIECQ